MASVKIQFFAEVFHSDQKIPLVLAAMKFFSVVRDLEPLTWKLKVAERHNIKFKPVQTFKRIVIYLKFTVMKDILFRHGNCRRYEAPVDQNGGVMIMMRHDNREVDLQEQTLSFAFFRRPRTGRGSRDTRDGCALCFPRNSPLRVSRTPRVLRARLKKAKERAEWNHRGEYNS